MNIYTIKVKNLIPKNVDDGSSEKPKSTTYIVSATYLLEAETKMVKYLDQRYSDYTIESINISHKAEAISNGYECEKVYHAQLEYFVGDKPKPQRLFVWLTEDSFTNALEKLRNTYTNMEVVSLSRKNAIFDEELV